MGKETMDERRELPREFRERLRGLEESYLRETDPIRQSGFGGGAARWADERGHVLEAVERDGELLDVGCANGYLLECLVKWAARKGVTLVPYGLDLEPRLIELARARFPEYADHFWAGNAWDWVPPRKFRYVYTLADCVPDAFLKEYVSRLLDLFVEEDGLLIVGVYVGQSAGVPAPDMAGILRALGFRVADSATRGLLPTSRIAWIHKEETRIAHIGE